MPNVIELPSRFDWKRKLNSQERIVNDDCEVISVPYAMWVFFTQVETEAGIQYVAETISPHITHSVGGTEKSALYRLLVRISR